MKLVAALERHLRRGLRRRAVLVGRCLVRLAPPAWHLLEANGARARLRLRAGGESRAEIAQAFGEGNAIAAALEELAACLERTVHGPGDERQRRQVVGQAARGVVSLNLLGHELVEWSVARRGARRGGSQTRNVAPHAMTAIARLYPLNSSGGVAQLKPRGCCKAREAGLPVGFTALWSGRRCDMWPMHRRVVTAVAVDGERLEHHGWTHTAALLCTELLEG